MKYLVLFHVILLSFTLTLKSQSRAELEERRNKTLEEIEYVDNLLKSTALEKNESMNALRIIGNKLSLRESVIDGMREEVTLLSERIGLNTIAIEMMERDLNKLKNDYERAVINSFRSRKGNPELVYILSARDFNQGYKRIKYLQQVTKFRRRESEIILELKEQIQGSRERLQIDFLRISDLKAKEEYQKNMMQSDQEKKKGIITSLTKKEKQLRKRFGEQKKTSTKD